jgi:hypothetical protein
VADKPTVARAMKGLVNWICNMRVDELAKPSEGSPAEVGETSAADEVRRRLLANARGYAAMRILTARSCLHGVQVCFDLPDPAPACHTLCRTVIENSARANWLILRGLDADERMARAAADELHGLTEERKFTDDDEWLVGKRERVTKLHEELAAAGIKPAARPPGVTVTAELLSGGKKDAELIYRLFSATPHGSTHLLGTASRHFGMYVEPARLATLGLMLAFDEFTTFMGWGGRATFHQWASRTYGQLRLADHATAWDSND